LHATSRNHIDICGPHTSSSTHVCVLYTHTGVSLYRAYAIHDSQVYAQTNMGVSLYRAYAILIFVYSYTCLSCMLICDVYSYVMHAHMSSLFISAIHSRERVCNIRVRIPLSPSASTIHELHSRYLSPQKRRRRRTTTKRTPHTLTATGGRRRSRRGSANRRSRTRHLSKRRIRERGIRLRRLLLNDTLLVGGPGQGH
jgi:hypothetical protein